LLNKIFINKQTSDESTTANIGIICIYKTCDVVRLLRCNRHSNVSCKDYVNGALNTIWEPVDVESFLVDI